MKNIYEIMKEVLGFEVPEDKKEAFEKAWKENYRTVEEYRNAVGKRDEYKNSLDDVQKQLKKFDDVNVEDLRGQISTLTNKLQEEKDARAKDAAKVELEKTVDIFLGGKNFVNALTRDSIRGSLLEELDKDTAKGKSVEELFTALITDKDGNQMENILVDEQQQRLEQNKAKFTQAANQQTGTAGSRGKYSMTELMKMANDGVDVSQYMN